MMIKIQTMKRIITIFLVALIPMMAMSQGNITRPGTKPQKQTTHQNNSGGKKKRNNTGSSNRNNANRTNSQTKPTSPQEVKVPVKPAPQPTPTPQPKPLTGTINGHDWVDLGLSVKWATCNVGASIASDYGGYYAWGETSTKSRYDWNNCFDCLDSTGDSWGIYKVDGQTRITPTSGHDTARENWGGTWRMPTVAELDELCEKCQWTWTSQGGHKGYQVTGPNGNSIFLPAAGLRYGTDRIDVGEYGIYWSSTLSSSNSCNARILYFYGSNHYTDYGNRRGCQGVRPVTD